MTIPIKALPHVLLVHLKRIMHASLEPYTSVQNYTHQNIRKQTYIGYYLIINPTIRQLVTKKNYNTKLRKDY